MIAEALEQAQRVLDPKSGAIAQRLEGLDAGFLKSVELICRCQEREKYWSTSLLITDTDTKPIGVLLVHDFLKAGLI